MQKFLKNNYIFIIIVIIIFLIKSFIYTPVLVDGPSMEPTLKNGNIMILSRLAYYNKSPQRFDIVVINKKTPIIKRVIGLPGETLSIRSNKLYINNKIINQPFKHYQTADYQLNETIPDDYYFVMGDNRPISNDSRNFGLISKSEILGNIYFSILPSKTI